MQVHPHAIKFSLPHATHMIKFTRLSPRFFVWVKGHAIICARGGVSLGTRLFALGSSVSSNPWNPTFWEVSARPGKYLLTSTASSAYIIIILGQAGGTIASFNQLQYLFYSKYWECWLYRDTTWVLFLSSNAYSISHTVHRHGSQPGSWLFDSLSGSGAV